MRAVLGAVAAVAGCGSGVTRAEWARKADAICAEYERRYDSLGTADELPDLARLQKARASAGRARTAARRGDEEAVSVAIGESYSAAAQAQHSARDLGARACAEP